MTRVSIYALFALLELMVQAGCMKLGPDYRQPELGTSIPASYQNAPMEIALWEPQHEWWQVFNDTELNQLVEEVIKNNLDLQKATAVVLEVRAHLVETRADRYPSVDVDADGQRQKRPIIGLSPGGRTFSSLTNTFTLSLPATFEFDLWGRLARAEEGVQAKLLQADENRRTVAQTVVAESISLYLNMESLERKIRITEKLIETLRRSLALVDSRYQRGLASVLDVRQARRTLAQTEAAMPILQQDLGTTQQQLSVLVGRYPKTRPTRVQPEDYFKQLDPVPPGLPSELLLRRPDIRAAEAQLMALNAEVGVSKASRFPRITLTGAYGYSSNELRRLIRIDSELWQITAGITQPLFDGGKLKSGQRAAQARYQQGLAEYAKAVLTAFFEVESAFLTREKGLKRRDHILSFLQEARAAQRIAERRYARGLVDYLSVLDAQRTRFQAEKDLVDVDLAILNNRVALHRALGGGWANPGPLHPEWGKMLNSHADEETAKRGSSY